MYTHIYIYGYIYIYIINYIYIYNVYRYKLKPGSNSLLENCRSSAQDGGANEATWHRALVHFVAWHRDIVPKGPKN